MLILAEAAASKTPFYIVAGLLVAWALTLSALGLRSATFPGGENGGRLVMLTSAVLALGTMAAAVTT